MRLYFALLSISFMVACGGVSETVVKPAPTVPQTTTYDDVPDVIPVLKPPKKGLSELLTTESFAGPTLKVHFIDVGQGDGMLIQSPGGKNVLIDSGPPRSRKRVLSYLKGLKLGQIDLAVNSHPHADHIGNLVQVMDLIPVRNVLLSGSKHTTKNYESVISAMEKHKIKARLARRGQKVTIDPDLAFEVLGPQTPFVTSSRSDLNSNSVILRLQYKQISFLFTGDSEEETEHRLLSDPKSLESTVLKVAHHGSRYASSSSFLRAVSPKLAVISASNTNRYGHPAPETISRLESDGIEIIETRKLGHILLETDGKKMRLTAMSRDAKTYSPIKLSPSVARRMPETEEKAAPKTAPETAGALLDLNTATLDALIRLPGIGPKTAQKILDWRKTHQRFTKVEDLVKVKGIGKAKLRKLKGLVTVTVPKS